MSRGFTIIRILSLVFLVLIPAAAFAQQPASPATGKVNLIIERNLVRFETPGESRVWRVEVFNQTGELVYASGQINAATLEWPLQDQLDKPLSSGLYAYTLTASNENGVTSWTQQ